jgi:hypothetical protein
MMSRFMRRRRISLSISWNVVWTGTFDEVKRNPLLPWISDGTLGEPAEMSSFPFFPSQGKQEIGG